MTTGNERSSGRDGGAEKPQRHRPRFKWTAPFAWFEWATEWVAYWLSRWALIQVLQSVAALTILFTAFTYLAGGDQRAQESYNQAWQAINSAAGQGGSGGRIGAMQGLNEAGQSLSGVTVEDAVLDRIDLQGGDLPWANFQGTRLEGANLRDVDLRNANLQQAQLGEYSGAGETVQTDLRRADLKAADARDADLSSADLSEARLNDADLSDAVLDEANFQGAELKATVLEGASLFGANLQNALLFEVDISGANLADTKNLTQSQVDDAIGDTETKLPEGEGLQKPGWWYQDRSGELRWEGPLQPGLYWTTAFHVPLEFTLGKGWKTVGTESITSVELDWKDSGLGFLFISPEEVYDPHGLASAEVIPFPKDMVAWLRSHPYLIADKPIETDIGGIEGTQVDVEITTMPDDYPNDLCEDPCLPLTVEPGGEALRVYEGGYGFIVLEVQGEPVVVVYDLEEGNPAKVEEVLKTLEWR
jgi:uncharacterized protein YjbI with pentapeptide repeats